MIKEQQKTLLELSAPVIRVWDKIIMVPLVGMLDSQRTQLVMEKLLEALETTQSKGLHSGHLRDPAGGFRRGQTPHPHGFGGQADGG